MEDEELLFENYTFEEPQWYISDFLNKVWSCSFPLSLKYCQRLSTTALSLFISQNLSHREP